MPIVGIGLCAALGFWALNLRRDRGATSPADAAHTAGVTRAAPTAPVLQRALALGWRSALETRFDARPLAAEHTTSVRFMAAYEAAFRGVLLTDGTGSYRLGLAPYSSLGSPAIEVAVGGATFTYPLSDPVLTDNDFRKGAPRQPARKWRHLTVTLTSDRVSVYLDGVRAGAFTAGSTRAAGALRFGRLATPGEVQDQFYGFVDDVAIFERALTDSEVQALARRSDLHAAQQHLIAAWSFDEGEKTKSPAEPPFTLLGGARLSAVSAARLDAEDSAALPKPAHETRFTLPFATGEVWLVIQGVNSSLSHHDSAAFALDFLRVDPGLAADNPARLPGGSHAASAGALFVAPADGKVVARVDCFPNDNHGRCPAAAYSDLLAAPVVGDPANRNLLCLEHTAGEVSCALHFRTGSIRGAQAEHVLRGRPLAEVGKTGARSVHLHFAVSDLTEPNTPGSFASLVTFPVAFSDYEASSDFGASWRFVAQGVPNPGEWLRRAPAAEAAR